MPEIYHSSAPELLSQSPYLYEIEGWIEADSEELAQRLIPEDDTYLPPMEFLEITSLFILSPEHRLSHINGWQAIYQGFNKDFQQYCEDKKGYNKPARKKTQVERKHMRCLLGALIDQYHSFLESQQGSLWNDSLAAESDQAEMQSIHIMSRLQASQTHKKYLAAQESTAQEKDI